MHNPTLLVLVETKSNYNYGNRDIKFWQSCSFVSDYIKIDNVTV